MSDTTNIGNVSNPINDANLYNAQQELNAINNGSGIVDVNLPSQRANTLSEAEQLLAKLNADVLELDTIKAGLSSFNINQDEKFFYERKVKPLVDMIYFMAFASNSIATSADNMQKNTYGKKREIRHALELSHDMNNEIECLFKTLRKRAEIFRKGIEESIALGETIHGTIESDGIDDCGSKTPWIFKGLFLNCEYFVIIN